MADTNAPVAGAVLGPRLPHKEYFGARKLGEGAFGAVSLGCRCRCCWCGVEVDYVWVFGWWRGWLVMIVGVGNDGIDDGDCGGAAAAVAPYVS